MPGSKETITQLILPTPNLSCIPIFPQAQGQFQAPFSEAGCYQARRDLDTSLKSCPGPSWSSGRQCSGGSVFCSCLSCVPCPATTEVDER